MTVEKKFSYIYDQALFALHTACVGGSAALFAEHLIGFHLAEI